MMRPISISLSPNTQRDDIFLALRLLLKPWQWKRGGGILQLEEEFAKYLKVEHTISFNSGRSALLAILYSLRLEEGDEVLLQAFTCNAVPNPILWAGLKPVYVDCREDDFNMDPADLERKITKNSKVVIVQHTFGLPASLDEILEICNRHNLILIEDCAHALGAKYKGKPVGTFGKASFFSFSRDKVISCIYGGMVATNDKDLALAIRQFQKKVGYPSFWWIGKQLIHPVVINWVILPTYRFLGKYLLVLLQGLQVLSKAVHWLEKRGRKPGYFPKAMPQALAILALRQLSKLEKFNTHRKELASFYFQEIQRNGFLLPAVFTTREHIFLRFPLRHKRAYDIIKNAWSQNLLIGDWYTSPVAPEDTRLDAMQYLKGSCPVAENLSRTTLNLPTHINISKEDAQEIVDFINNMKL